MHRIPKGTQWDWRPNYASPKFNQCLICSIVCVSFHCHFLSWIFWLSVLSAVCSTSLLADSLVALCNHLMQYFFKSHFQVFPGLCILLHICTSVPSVETFVLWWVTNFWVINLLSNCLSVTSANVFLCHYSLLLWKTQYWTGWTNMHAQQDISSVLQVHCLYYPALAYIIGCKADHKEVRSASCQWNELFIFQRHHVSLKCFYSIWSVIIQAFLCK